MTQYDLGQVVGATGATGATGADGSTIWHTSTAPTYYNNLYTFTTSNLTGKTGFTPKENDLIFYDSSYYIISDVTLSTVDCEDRISIKGADGSSATVTIVDNLNSDSSTSVLSAKQGKVLNTNKVETSAIKSSFSATTLDTNIASEKLVKTELDKKITKASTATGLLKDDGTVMTSGTGSSNWAVGNHTHSAYVNPTIVDNLTSDSSTSVLSAKQGKVLNTNKIETSAIANNLTTTASGYVLDARQGKALADMIGSAITYITGSGS